MSDRIDHVEALERALIGEQVDPAVEPLATIAVEVRQTLLLSAPSEAPHLRTGRTRASRRLQVVLAAALVALLTLGGSVSASALAVPGDALYPVKRAVERVSLAVERDPIDRAGLRLGFAERRLDELSIVLDRRRRAGEQVDVGAAMSSYRTEVLNAESELRSASATDAQLDALQARLTRHVDRLNAIAAQKSNPRAAEAIQRAIDNAQRAAGRLAEKKANKGERGKPQKLKHGGPPETPGRSAEAPGRS